MGSIVTVALLALGIAAIALVANHAWNREAAARRIAEAQAGRRAALRIGDADAVLMHRAAGFGINLDTFRDVVGAPGQPHGRFTGSVARVESHGHLRARVTATRLALVGIYALALQKKVDDRELYVTVEGADFQLVVQLPGAKGLEARQWAAVYNTRSGTATGPAGAPAAAVGVSGELESLAILHANGKLSDAEFTAAKARLLGPAAQPQDRRPW